MTSLSATPKPHMLKLAAAAQDLAPHLYRAECAFHGITPNKFEELSPAQQRMYFDRAEFHTLDIIGWLSGKARDRAHRKAVHAHSIYDQFNEDACRVIEQAMADAVKNYPDELQRAYRESVR